jgi:hypothetical protein
MPTISRRKLLASLGGVGGAAVLSGCGNPIQGPIAVHAEEANSQEKTPKKTSVPTPTKYPPWRYSQLDPQAVAQRAYDIYPQGGCMYAVVGSVIGTLADQVGEPFRSFPIEMMRYGDGGVGAWGSLCGVVNGGAALIGMFHNEKPKEQREALIAELGAWYETTPLPQFKPPKPEWADEAESSVAESLLCHVSVTRWSEASSCEAFSVEKKERCRRLAADGASKVVQLLNQTLNGDCIEGKLTTEVHSCVDCHGKQNQADAMVRMNCATCHQFESEHP